MFMEAIAASLHDVDQKEAEQKNKNAVLRNETTTPSANSSRLDSFSQRLRSTLFRGGRRNGSK